jgi:hypothetical protein
MRKCLRLMLLDIALLVVPGANALEQIQCLPGEFQYIGVLHQYRCVFTEQGTHCLLCSYAITVEG